MVRNTLLCRVAATSILVALSAPAFSETISQTERSPLLVKAQAELGSRASRISYDFSISQAGTYTFLLPSDRAAVFALDGKVLLNVEEGTKVADGAPVRVLTSLAGPNHMLEIVSAGDAVQALESVKIMQFDSEPVSLRSFRGSSSPITRTATATPASEAPVTAELGSEPAPEREVFTIAGASSAAARQSIVETSAEKVVVSASSQSSSVTGVSRQARVASVEDEEEETAALTGVSLSNSAAAVVLEDNAPRWFEPTGVSDRDPQNISTRVLTPPRNPQITQAIQLTSIPNGSPVPATGVTVFGAVQDPGTYDIVNVEFIPTGRTTTVDVGAIRGQFAVRIFPEDFDGARIIKMRLTGASSDNPNVTTFPVDYGFIGDAPTDGVVQAVSRITFGATQQLYTQIQNIGFEDYVERQLNPSSISDPVVRGMNLNRLIRRDVGNNSYWLRQALNRMYVAQAAFSNRQLQEVMARFWENHFHAINKDSGIVYEEIEDIEFFRNNAFGSFETLLEYSAKSPLMSQYLDNDQSRRGRINENYGRELLELHTVGVNGGYTDEDVIAVSRVFTGWVYERTNEGQDAYALYDFEFRPDRHDFEDKEIPFLNVTIQGRTGAAGVQEGEELIAILAQDPRTRSFVCRKIVQLLVSDNPDQGFVDICVAEWAATRGDIGSILRAILLNPAYINTAEFQRNKGKTPFEYMVNFVRNFASVPSRDDMEDFLGRYNDVMERGGMSPLYFPAPTGLPEVGVAWTNTASMVGRFESLTGATENPDRLGVDIDGIVEDNGMETAEEAAAYILGIGTADRYHREEFEAMVDLLKGSDGVFDPTGRDETRAIRRALGLLIVTPSYQLQ